MSFPSSPSPSRYIRFPSPRTRMDGPVLAVGHRVIVQAPGGGAGHVSLTNHLATTTLGTLDHGVEVEILAWQPYGGNGTRYRVLSRPGGLEGWVGGDSLKRLEPLPVPRPRVLRVDPVSPKAPAAARRTKTVAKGRATTTGTRPPPQTAR